jgi:poly(3-hydroxybutyrate) depolymerase
MKLDNIILKVLMIMIVLILLITIILYVFALSSRDRRVLFQKPSIITVGGAKRSYLISTPRSKMPTKLVIGLHGFGDSPRKFAYYSALHNSVDDQTLLIYPAAVKPNTKAIKAGWNSGFCCGSGWVSKTDDVLLIKTLITETSATYGIKAENTFLVGFSNGAFMAQRFVAERPELIGGIVAASGTIGTTKISIEPKAAVPILLMHGKKDKTIPFLGGFNLNDPEFDWLPFSKTRSVWKEINGDQAKTKVIVYEDGKHTWNGWRLFNFWHQKTNASYEAASFFNSIKQ